VGQGYRQITQPNEAGPDFGFSVKAHRRLTRRFGQNLDLAPGDSLRAGAERLHHCLFAGKTGRQRRGPALAQADLRVSVDALKKALAEPPACPVYPLDLDDVNACSRHTPSRLAVATIVPPAEAARKGQPG